MTQERTDYELGVSNEQAEELRDAGWIDPDQAAAMYTSRLRPFGPTEKLESAFALVDAFATDRSGYCQACDHHIRSVARDKKTDERLCLWCVLEAAYRMGFEARGERA